MTSSAGTRVAGGRTRLPAVRLRHDGGERAERIASIALAGFITVGAMVLVIAAPARFALTSPAVQPRANATTEHVVYVGAQTMRPVAAPSQQASAAMKALASSDTMADVADDVSISRQDQVTTTPPASASAADPPAATATATAAPVGAPAAGLTVGFSTRRRGSIRYDSALGVVQDNLSATLAARRLERPAPTQAERDEQMRAESRDEVAARGAGTPHATGTMAAGGIAVPLPFGGPSNAQRERDRRAYEETKRMMARVQRRADSVVAARRRRFADSLAQVADSQLRRTIPR